MSELIERKTEIEKPAILYHASPNRDVAEFESRAETTRDPNEGPVVFATPDKAFASCFIVPTDDRWTDISVFENDICAMVIGDKKRFEEADKGGSIYSLSSDTFNTDLGQSMQQREWISKEPVRPIDKSDYKTGLQAMIENGVKVYFVDPETLERIKKADDHGQAIIA